MPNLPTNKYALLTQDVPTVVVNAATANGTAKSIFFAIQGTPEGVQRTVTFIPRQVGGVTAATATILASSDGGATTQTYPPGTALTLISASVLTPVVVSNLVPGLTYELSIGGLTGGTNISVDAIVS